MWYAIYTKHGKEDPVSFVLQNIGIEVLNPKLKSRKYKRNKFIEVIEPLFPSYLFASFEKEKYAHLISYTRGVRYIVGKSNPIIVHDEIVNTLRERLEEGNVVVVKPQRFEKGDKVIIKEGPFKDFYGIFEKELKGPERVMVLLETMHYSLELDSYFLTRA